MRLRPSGTECLRQPSVGREKGRERWLQRVEPGVHVGVLRRQPGRLRDERPDLRRIDEEPEMMRVVVVVEITHARRIAQDPAAVPADAAAGRAATKNAIVATTRIAVPASDCTG